MTPSLQNVVGLPKGPFQTIVADPPWKVKAGPGGPGYSRDPDGIQRWGKFSKPSRDLAYPSMSIEEICSIPVQSVVGENAHLYIWTINRYVEETYQIARAWGFKPSTLLVWAKTPFGGGLGGAFGISTEFCLFCRRGTLKSTGRVKGTWFNWLRPYDERGKPRHSAKPEAFQDMVESVSPGPYLEMFARRPRLGWTVWGNEVGNKPDTFIEVDIPFLERIAAAHGTAVVPCKANPGVLPPAAPAGREQRVVGGPND